MKTLAIAALVAAAPANAAPPPCLTTAEIEHLTMFVIPPVYDAIAAQCRASLPQNAYLLNGGATLSQRLAADRGAHWEAARGAFLRISGEQKMASLGADTASNFLRDMVKAQGSEKLTAENCGTVDRALGLLSPLPPENIAGLLALGLEMAGRGQAEVVKGDGKDDKAKKPAMPSICPAQPA